MIILMPVKFFKKKIEKLVKAKDFTIADAMERGDEGMNEYGNRVVSDELNATPVLIKIAQDPDSDEAKIKRKRLSRYLQLWFEDESFQLKILFLVKECVKHWKECNEDMNVFVVLRNPVFWSYGKAMCEAINSIYGDDTAVMMHQKMSKKEIKKIVNAEFDDDYYKHLKKTAKKLDNQFKSDGKPSRG